MTAEAKLEPSNVNVRVISALWTSMLFVFAYVDLFSLYRPDFRADLEAGEIEGFAINQSFLLGTTVYVVIPSLMVFCTLILRPNGKHAEEPLRHRLRNVESEVPAPGMAHNVRRLPAECVEDAAGIRDISRDRIGPFRRRRVEPSLLVPRDIVLPRELFGKIAQVVKAEPRATVE
jgi:hypothetical protein